MAVRMSYKLRLARVVSRCENPFSSTARVMAYWARNNTNNANVSAPNTLVRKLLNTLLIFLERDGQ